MSVPQPIIDGHHHIWRQTDLPWLLGPTQPRIFGPYESIKRDYLIDEYRTEAEAEGVVRSVYVQANWAPNWFMDEAKWVKSVADATGWPHAIVAFADLTDRDASEQLQKLSSVPLVRGIRQQLHWHENPLYRFARRPDLAADPIFRRNVALLADYGWTFDLQVFADQMENAAGLAAACPDVMFVLQHAGMLEDFTEAGLARWRAGMRRLGDQPNVVCKLSGLGTFLRQNDPSHIAMVVHETLAFFGAERCLFGSNFPIEKIWTRYGELIAAYRAAIAGHPADVQQAIFVETARRVYRL